MTIDSKVVRAVNKTKKGDNEMKMMKKLREKSKNKKGFTLVELIVVLVILAILAALLVPALTGYIDKANEKKVIAEARSALMGCQTIASEQYADVAGGTAIAAATVVTKGAALAEVTDTKITLTDADISAGGKITKLIYTSDGYTATYTVTANKGTWKVAKV